MSQLVTRNDVIRNRFAYKVSILASKPSDPIPWLPDGTFWEPGHVPLMFQRSIGGVGGFANFEKTYVSRLRYSSPYPKWKQRMGERVPTTTDMDLDWYHFTVNPVQGRSCTVGPLTLASGIIEQFDFMGGNIIPCEDPNPAGNNRTLPSELRWGPGVITELDDICHNQFIGNVSDECDVMFSVFVAELGKTKRMIADRTTSLLDSAFHLRSRLRALSKDGVTIDPSMRKHASRLFLEYQFGWKQLYRDLKDLHKTLRTKLEEPELKHVKAYVTDLPRNSTEGRKGKNPTRRKVEVRIDEMNTTYDSSWRQPVKLCDGPLNDLYCATRSLEYGYKFCYISAGVEPSVEGVSDRQLKRISLHWSDFVTTAWELVPFSFVVDYFVPVGQFLAQDWDIIARVKWAQRTHGYRAIGMKRMVLLPVGDTTHFNVPSDNTMISSIERKTIERRDYTQEARTGVTFTLKVPGDTQLLNLIALYHS